MLDYSIDFLNGAKIKIKNNNVDGDYKVTFKDNDTNDILYQTILKPGHYAKSKIIYYINWNITVEKNNIKLLDYNLNLNDKIVVIRMQSKSLGDTLAWSPYIEEFRKKHNCKIYFSTFLNFLFDDQYPNVNFIKPNEKIENTFAEYHIGWFNPFIYKNPNDYKKIPLQKTATDILGLNYNEIIPKIKKQKNPNPYNQKYVCIAEYSTANAKHWHYPIKNSNKGWQFLVDWLNYLGYKVLVISKQETKLKNIIDRTGNYPLEWRISELMNCEFFIGVGSGLSWLAWSLNKKVVMISGFSDPICEFKENNIRIINKNVCNSCFNKFEFDRGDWDWCPIHKNTYRHFECTKSITPKMVAEEIIKNGLVENKEGFNFELNINDIKIENDDIDIKYVDNKMSFYYKKDDSIFIHIDVKDEFNNYITNLRNVELNKKHILWSTFESDSDYFSIDFFNDKNLLINKILKI